MAVTQRLGTRFLIPAIVLVCALGAPGIALGQSPQIIWSEQDLSGGIQSVSFSPNGKFLAYSASGDVDIRIRRATDGLLLRSFTTGTEPLSGVDQVAFAPTGLALASTWNITESSGGYTFFFGGLELWSASSPPPLQTERHSNYATCLAWAPDGQSIVSGSTDRTVILWDATTAQKIRNFNHGAWIQSVAFSPDGTLIASGAADNIIKIWDAETGDLVRTLSGHTDYVRSLEFSPDGTVIASGAGGFNSPDDHSIKIWQVSDGALLDTFLGHGNWVLDLDFAFGGAILGSVSLDGTIRFWRVADGTELISYTPAGGLPLCLDVAPNNQTFAYGLNNGTVVHARP